MTELVSKSPAESRLILSVFPGADLLGRAFEAEGFCVVRGPDLVWGGDIRGFHPPRGVFWGIIGGSPCQDFSSLRRSPPTGYGVEMLDHWVRIVTEARPEWFILENVPRVPSISVFGYYLQRFNLAAKECGGSQARLRCFQFGNRVKAVPLVTPRSPASGTVSRAALASEGTRKGRRSFADFCELQGLPRDFDLPGLSIAAQYRAVGNGVPLQLGRVIARAVAAWAVTDWAVRVCLCDCGRPVTGRQTLATAACRKRMERRRRDRAAGDLRRRDTAAVTARGPVTAWRVTVPPVSE